jgi:DNA-binding response OmpR family regulator
VNVLIVSRSERARAWIRAALDPSWSFREASNGIEALQMARESDDVDLVVADESSEPFGAFGLARDLKVLPFPPAVIVLLERPQDVWLAKWSGADRWLTQQIDPFELGATAREVLAEREGSGPKDAGLGLGDDPFRYTEESQTAGVERYPH